MEIHFLPDEPTKDDSLGFSSFTTQIQKAIYNTQPPFVFGVLGDWGSGKTSVLKQLEQLLNDDLEERVNFYIPIWFNAWLYENENNVAYPLLHAIKRDYKNRLKDSNFERGFWKSFYKAVGTSTLALTDICFRAATKKITGDAYSLKDVGDYLKTIQDNPDELDNVLNNWADQVTELGKAFRNLLDSYASDYCEENYVDDNSIKFVILVDDLDRCLPDVSIKLLESIKNYLTVKNCIFVLALNPKVVYQGVTLKYQGIQVNGREYLEKILNYSFYIPEAENSCVEAFATSHLNDLISHTESNDAYISYFNTFGKVLCECNFKNPRKIKRVLNHYLLFLDKFKNHLVHFNMINIPKLIVLAEYYPDIFKLWVSAKDNDAEQELQGKLAGWEESGFDIKDFEGRYGISILSIYDQLCQQKKLLILQTSIEKYSLSQQARAVFEISRLP